MTARCSTTTCAATTGTPSSSCPAEQRLHPDYLGDLGGLSDGRRLIVPHLRGVGRSPAPAAPEAGSFWRQAGDVEALRRHLGLEKLALAGHSAGTR